MKLAHRTVERFIKVLLGRPLYLADVPRRLGEESSAVPGQGLARVVILEKSRYHESVRRFPMSNPREIRQAVHMDILEYSPFATEMFFIQRLEHSSEGALAALWFVRPDTASIVRTARPWVLLPETAVLGACLAPGAYRARRPRDTLLLHVQADRRVASLTRPRSSSAQDPDDKPEAGSKEPIDDAAREASGLDQGSEDAALFRRILGCRDPRARDLSSPDAYPDLLRRSWAAFPLTGVKPFLVSSAEFSLPTPRATARALAPAAVILAVFLALWLSLPWQAQREFSTRNEALNAQLGPLLDLQADLERDQGLALELARPVQDYLPRTQLVSVLIQTLPPDARLTGLNIAGPTVQITGHAAQASAVIAALSAAPGLRDVRFASPVNTDTRSGRERFVIGFTLYSDLAAARDIS